MTVLPDTVEEFLRRCDHAARARAALTRTGFPAITLEEECRASERLRDDIERQHARWWAELRELLMS